MSKSSPGSTELTHVNILNLARELNDGVWIEKICKQVRGLLAGNGLAELKDVPEKIKTLPALTGAASHQAWHAAVLKLIGESSWAELYKADQLVPPQRLKPRWSAAAV